MNLIKNHNKLVLINGSLNPFNKRRDFGEDVCIVGMSAGHTIGDDPHLIVLAIGAYALEGPTRVPLTGALTTKNTTAGAHVLLRAIVRKVLRTLTIIGQGLNQFLQGTCALTIC